MIAEELWRYLFGRLAPVEVEIGSGTGAFLFTAAVMHPERDFLGIEYSSSRVRRLTREIEQRGLSNAHVLRADATCVTARLLPDDSVAAYHIAFPDPWWKRRHHRRRLFTVEFVAALERTLVPGGVVHVITDVGDYFSLMTGLLQARLERVPELTDRPVITRFERKALARGAAIQAAAFRKLAR